MGLAIIVPSVSFDDANLGKVTLSGNVPIRGLYINLEDSYTGVEVDLKCSYLPANTTQRGVVWSIESGSEYASISGSTLTILSGADDSPVTIKCTSVENSSVSTEKIVNLTYDEEGDNLIIYEGRSIKGDGTAYINLTKNFTGEKRFNVIASNWEVIFEIDDAITVAEYIFGGFEEPIKAQYGALVRENKYNNCFRVPDKDIQYSILNKKIKAINQQGQVTLYYNDTVVQSDSVTQGNTLVGDLTVFGRNHNDVHEVSIDFLSSHIKLFSLKLSTLAYGEICNLVPCRYYGVVGMYNKTTGEVMLPEVGEFTLI